MTNAVTLEGLAAKLPAKIRLVAGFMRKGEEKARFSPLLVTLLGFTRDEQGYLVIKIDSPERVNPRRRALSPEAELAATVRRQKEL